MIQRGGYNSESVPAKSCSRIKRWLPLESWVSTVTGWKGPTPPHPSHHSTCGLDKTNILTIHVSEDLSDIWAQCWLYLWQIMYHLAGRECDRTEGNKHGDQKLDQVWAHTSPLICHRSGLGGFWRFGVYPMFQNRTNWVPDTAWRTKVQLQNKFLAFSSLTSWKLRSLWWWQRWRSRWYWCWIPGWWWWWL